MPRDGGAGRRKGKEIAETGEGSRARKVYPKKSAKLEWDIYNNRELKAYPDWENVPEPWSLRNAIKYVGFPHINRWCDPRYHQPICKSKQFPYDKIQSIEAKWRCLEILRFLSNEERYDRHKIPRKVVVMVYVEVELRKTVNWSTLLERVNNVGELGGFLRQKFQGNPPSVIPSLPVPDWFRNEPNLLKPGTEALAISPTTMPLLEDGVGVRSPTQDEAVFTLLTSAIGIDHTGHYVSESTEVDGTNDFGQTAEASTQDPTAPLQIPPMGNVDGGNLGLGLVILGDVALETNPGGAFHEVQSNADLAASCDNLGRALVVYKSQPVVPLVLSENVVAADTMKSSTPNMEVPNFVEPKPNQFRTKYQPPSMIGQDGTVEEGVVPRPQEEKYVDVRVTTVLNLRAENCILKAENQRLKAEIDELKAQKN